MGGVCPYIYIYATPPPLIYRFGPGQYDLKRFQCYCEGLKVTVILVGTLAVTILAALAAAEASSIYYIK